VGGPFGFGCGGAVARASTAISVVMANEMHAASCRCLVQFLPERRKGRRGGGGASETAPRVHARCSCLVEAAGHGGSAFDSTTGGRGQWEQRDDGSGHPGSIPFW